MMSLRAGDRVRLKTTPRDVATALVGKEILGTIVDRKHKHSAGHLLMEWDEVFNVVPGNTPGTRAAPKSWDMSCCWVTDSMVEVLDDGA